MLNLVLDAVVLIAIAGLALAAWYWRDDIGAWLDNVIPFKGWRVMILNGVVTAAAGASMILGFLDVIDWTLIVSPRTAGFIVLGISITNMLLRKITDTPIGVAVPPPAPPPSA